MTSSKPATPLSNRRHTSSICDQDETTTPITTTSISKIPLPSPGPFRRSISLRLRGSQSYINDLTSISGSIQGGVAFDDDDENFSTLNRDRLSSTRKYQQSSPPKRSDIVGDYPEGKGRTATDKYFSNNTAGLSRQKGLKSSRSLSLITAEHNFYNEKDPHSGASFLINKKRTSLSTPPVVSNNFSNGDATSSGLVDSVNGCTISGHGRGSALLKREPHGMSLNLNGPTTAVSSGSSSAVRTPKTPITPRTPNSIGPPNKLTPKTPPVTPDSPHLYLDDDLDSLYSYSSATSGRSTMSCEHPYVARNGTTFSGRKMKYVVHCSSYAGQVGEDYLTPTQRAQRQLRRLKELLTQARHDLEQKDSEILRLTREVVELRLFKASLSSPEDRSNSSDAVTVREATTDLKTSQDVSPIVDMIDDGIKSSPRHVLHHHGIHQVQFMEKMSNSEMQSSFADSGHFEDMTTSSVHSKDSFVQTQDRACGSDHSNSSATFEEQRQELIEIYEKRIEELVRDQDAASSEIKRTHNDRIEALLQKLAECNTRYADMVPDYEQAKERIRELEKQLEDLQRKLTEQEDHKNKMYLAMYAKGQEAERIAHADQVLEFAHRAPNRVSVPELLQQLQTTQDELENIRTIYRRLLEAQQNKTKVDPEITLEFLKSAIYYFLTDKENSQGHLNAIESILEFSDQQKYNISKARAAK